MAHRGGHEKEPDFALNTGNGKHVSSSEEGVMDTLLDLTLIRRRRYIDTDHFGGSIHDA